LLGRYGSRWMTVFNARIKIPVFYARELPLLKGKTPEQLREIHKLKLAFGPGSSVKQ